MDCVYSCLYCGDQFLERYVRGRKAVQIVLGVIGGALLMVILLAIFGAFRKPACAGPPAEYAVLAKAWPPNTCALGKKFSTGSLNKCKPKDKLPATFTLQGVWLRLLDRQSTLMRCGSRADLFDPTKLTADLRGKLEKQWPSLFTGHTENQYWAFEWNLAGSCTRAEVKPEDYFSRSVAIDSSSSVGDLLKWLADKGIKPSNEAAVKLADVRAAIKEGGKLGDKQFAVHCHKTANGAKDGKEHPLLEHVIFCLADHSLNSGNLRDCTEDLLKVETESCGAGDFYLLENAEQPWGPEKPVTTTTTTTTTTTKAPTTPEPTTKKESERTILPPHSPTL